VGAAFALGIMSGAIFFHLASPLGIDRITMAAHCSKSLHVWLSAAFILLSYRAEAVATVAGFIRMARA